MSPTADLIGRVTARGAAAAMGCAAALALAGPAAANNPLELNFGPTVGDGMSEAQQAREFAKQWEGNPEAGFPTLAIANVEATKTAIKRYGDIVAAGGWKVVPDVEMKPGESHFAAVVLRDRLLVSGELAADSGAGEVYDDELVTAVKKFQSSNGLTPTGRVDARTIAALNITAESRLKQLKGNLPRITEYATSAKANKKYVVVNIPAAQVEAVALNKVISRHAGVVGKPDRPTPLLRSTITEMNFNPIWRLPPTVIEKDLIPQGRELQASGQSVLVKMGIDAYDGSGKKVEPTSIDWSGAQPKSLSYRQQPGKENPLGFVKINFASSESVYMHDTPSNTLFGRNFRAASSGCIRVNNVEKLAYWLLGQNDGWDQEKVEGLKASGKRLDVRLATPVPLYFVYITAWATQDGTIQFRRDLYNKDGIGETAASY